MHLDEFIFNWGVRHFFFLLLLFLIYLLELLSFEKLYFFDDEYDDDGSGSGSPGTCAFTFCSDYSIVCVSGVGSNSLFQLESSQYVTLFQWLCLYQEVSSLKLVES